MERGPLQKKHWRKSESWVMLNRKHAEAVAADTAVAAIFEKECVTTTDRKTSAQKVCIPDEVRAVPLDLLGLRRVRLQRSIISNSALLLLPCLTLHRLGFHHDLVLLCEGQLYT